jgi:hypothetical protein
VEGVLAVDRERAAEPSAYSRRLPQYKRTIVDLRSGALLTMKTREDDEIRQARIRHRGCESPATRFHEGEQPPAQR